MTEQTQDPMNDPEIQGEVVATGSACNSVVPGLGQTIEEAQVMAIRKCMAAGITNPAVILEAKQKALEDTLATYSCDPKSFPG